MPTVPTTADGLHAPTEANTLASLPKGSGNDTDVALLAKSIQRAYAVGQVGSGGPLALAANNADWLPIGALTSSVAATYSAVGGIAVKPTQPGLYRCTATIKSTAGAPIVGISSGPDGLKQKRIIDDIDTLIGIQHCDGSSTDFRVFVNNPAGAPTASATYLAQMVLERIGA